MNIQLHLLYMPSILTATKQGFLVALCFVGLCTATNDIGQNTLVVTALALKEHF